jgi:uncharacterized protein YqhQ
MMSPAFSYHGAELKTIFCYENLSCEVETSARKAFQPPCGTSFILVVLVLYFIGFFIHAENFARIV